MKKLVLFAIAALSVATATMTLCDCNKKSVWVYYNETQCADPWQEAYQASLDEGIEVRDENNHPVDLEDYVKEYLESKGVKILEIQTLKDGKTEECRACSCLTGFRYRCRISELDLPKVEKEHFYQESYGDE